MLRVARNVLGLIGALLLMLALAAGSFVLWRSNPWIDLGWFFAVSGIIYTMIILMVLHR